MTTTNTRRYEIITFCSGDPGMMGVWDKRTGQMVISPGDFRTYSAYQRWAAYADDEAVENKRGALNVAGW